MAVNQPNMQRKIWKICTPNWNYNYVVRRGEMETLREKERERETYRWTTFVARSVMLYHTQLSWKETPPIRVMLDTAPSASRGDLLIRSFTIL